MEKKNGKRLHETDDEDESSRPEANKKRPAKVYRQKFMKAYSKEFPTLSESRKGDIFAFCSACLDDINVSHGGKSDCRKHVETRKHKDKEKQMNRGNLKQAKLETLFGAKVRLEQLTTNAEATIVQIIAENNLPLAIADKISAVIPKIFPDSEIAASEYLNLSLSLSLSLS